MTLKQSLAALGLGLAATSASAVPTDLTFNFSSVPGAGISFNGNGGSGGLIGFINFLSNDFEIDNSNYIVGGIDVLDGLKGNVDGAPFTFNLVSSTPIPGGASLQVGTVSGNQTLIIHDGMGYSAQATLTFSSIASFSFTSGSVGSSSITLGTTVMNVTPVAGSYSGSNPGLIRFMNSAPNVEDPSILMSATFNTSPPARSLTQLLMKGAENNTNYSGTFYSAAPIPEPSTYAMVAVGLGMVGFSLSRSRRS